MKISFCTTCMGRAHHLKETLPQNIRDNPPTADTDVEFVVLNYNSKDDLHEWMTTDPKMKRHIESGLVRYGRTTDPEFFHMSHAKNMAHRMATGDVLCNLDADNFTGKDFAKVLRQNFAHDEDVILSPSFKVSRFFPPEERGFIGRIALSASSFHQLGGYDETYEGWGGEDNDFIRRAKGLGLKHLRFENLDFLNIIAHTNSERAVNMAHADDVLHDVEYKQHQESFLKKALKRTEVFIKPIQANHGQDYGRGLVVLENGQNLHFQKAVNSIMSPFKICALGLPELIKGRISPRLAQENADDAPIQNEIFRDVHI